MTGAVATRSGPRPALRAPRIALAGGGSGGHLFPGIAVARSLEAGGAPSLLFGSGRAGERRWVGNEVENLPLDAPLLPSRGTDVPRYAVRLGGALRRALGELRSRRVDLVLGLGGYASVAPGLAALLSGVPLVLLEQNAIPGKANRLLAGLGGRVAASFTASLGYLPVAARRRSKALGNPVRKEILSGRRDATAFGLAKDRPVVLVMGGSQGAKGLNSRVLAAAPRFVGSGVQLLHLTGAGEEERVRASLQREGVRAFVCPFSDRMGDLYATADLVLCRAGGTTVAELAAVGKPSVLVPYPHHRDRHQEENAVALRAAGAARLVREEDLSPDRIETEVVGLALDRERLASMSVRAGKLGAPDAADRVAEWVREILEGRWG